MQRLTNGVTRTVYLVGKYALKVPNGRYGWREWLRGLLANMQEREWSKAGYPELCPVLWADPFGFLVIMPRIKITTEQMSAMDYHYVFRDISPARNYRIPTENKPDSFGYYEGRLVAVDYGN